MLSLILICLIVLLVLVYMLYGGREHKDAVQVSVSALAGLWVVVNLLPLGGTPYGQLPNTNPKLALELPPNVDPATGRKYELLPTSIPEPLSSEIDTSPTCSIGSSGCGSIRSTTAHVEASSDKLAFQWPARGRIIQKFEHGSDGINIALPVGTPVKAVEDGIVAYSDSKIAGYGNMILIHHANGYVSAYAHNITLDVKKGDRVTRGQTIAKSGQSGNVGSPQLHFELRKSSAPVDPSVYLQKLAI